MVLVDESDTGSVNFFLWMPPAKIELARRV